MYGVASREGLEVDSTVIPGVQESSLVCGVCEGGWSAVEDEVARVIISGKGSVQEACEEVAVW